jgi:predicted transposase/invertase (TIGR01784 family)
VPSKFTTTMSNDPKVFMDLRNDFTFKHMLGEEVSKPITTHFLNAVLPPKDRVTSIEFKPTVKQGRNKLDRQAVFDLSCQTKDRRRIIIEMQKAAQKFFVDRSIFNITFPIQEQAIKGEWDYKLDPIYSIGILNFNLEGDYYISAEYLHIVETKTQNNKVFYKKLKWIYLELPNFTKKLDKLETELDFWMFLIKHLHTMIEMPTEFNKFPIFIDVFERARIASLNKQQLMAYQTSLKNSRDYKNTVDFAVEKAVEKEVKKEAAKNKKELNAALLEKAAAQAREVAAQQEKAAAQAREAAAEEEKEEFIRTSVFALHAAGFTPEQIAERLKLPLAKVLEILAV